MNYTNDLEQIVFIKDGNIAASLDARTVSGNAIAANGVPSFDLVSSLYNSLSTYDEKLSAQDEYLSGEIVRCQEKTAELSANTVERFRDTATDIAHISGAVDSVSADLSGSIDSADARITALSSEVGEVSAEIETQIDDIWTEIKGGVSYKGHLSSWDTDGTEYQVNLSTIFSRLYGHDESKELKNGWLYLFSTKAAGAIYTTLDGIELDDRDYIIVHNHNEGMSSVILSDLTKDTVDIIDAADTDYVRISLLSETSAALNTKIDNSNGALSTYVNEKFEDASESIEQLQNAVSGEIETLSAKISGEIEQTSANVIGYANSSFLPLSGDKSVGGTTQFGEIRAARIEAGQLTAGVDLTSPKISSKKIAIQNDDDLLHIDTDIYSDKLVENKKTNTGTEYSVSFKLPVKNEAYSGTFAMVDYVDAAVQAAADADENLSTEVSREIENLSIALSNDVDALSAKLSGEIDDLAEDTALSVSSLQNQVLSNDDDIEFLSTDLRKADMILNGTLSAVDKDAHAAGDISSLNLVITDPLADPSHKHGMYYMTFEYGTIVLNKMN